MTRVRSAGGAALTPKLHSYREFPVQPRLRMRHADICNSLCADIIKSFVLLDETQPRNIEAWRPVVVDVMEGYNNFPRDDFEKHIDTFYPLAVELLNREMGHEIRLALQALLRRVGESRMGMEPVRTPIQTPTSPRSISSAYFGRRSSRGR